MSFKDQVAADIDNVFINLGEFATEHEINGEKRSCVFDDDRMTSRSDNAAIGTALGEKLLFIKASLLPGKPMPGSRMEIDGKYWFVRNVIDNMGVLEIRVGVSKT